MARADHLIICLHAFQSAWIGLAPAGCNVIVYAVLNTPPQQAQCWLQGTTPAQQ